MLVAGPNRDPSCRQEAPPAQDYTCMIKGKMCAPSMMPVTLGHTFHYLEWYVLAGLWAWPGAQQSEIQVWPWFLPPVDTPG